MRSLFILAYFCFFVGIVFPPLLIVGAVVLFLAFRARGRAVLLEETIARDKQAIADDKLDAAAVRVFG